MRKDLVILALCVIAYAVCSFLLLQNEAAKLPRLQATGCDGAAGTLYAMEEDDLPFCNKIEEYRP